MEEIHKARVPAEAEACIHVKEDVVDEVVLRQVPVGTVSALIVGK
jgi:hypothetical protein